MTKMSANQSLNLELFNRRLDQIEALAMIFQELVNNNQDPRHVVMSLLLEYTEEVRRIVEIMLEE